MALTSTNGFVAGFYSAWIAFRSSAGYPIGNCITPDAPTINTVYPAFRMKYPVSITPLSATPQFATRFGGQRPRGRRYLGYNDYGTFTLTMDGRDESLDAFVRAYSLDTTWNTSMLMGAGNALLATPPRFILGLSMGFTDTDNGVDYFDTFIWNNVLLAKPIGEAGSENGNTNPNPLQWTVSPDLSTRTGMGALYSATGLNVIENTDLMIWIRDQYELYQDTYVANGSATTFNTTFKSKSSDATGAAGNVILKNGVITAVTSISTSTKVVTLAAAGSSADIYNLLYPTQYQ